MKYENALAEIIGAKIAPTVYESMKECAVIERSFSSQSVNVPLIAETSIAYNMKLGEILIRGTVDVQDKIGSLSCQQLFSTKPFFNQKDKSEVINALFDEMKRAFTYRLAKLEAEHFDISNPSKKKSRG